MTSNIPEHWLNTDRLLPAQLDQLPSRPGARCDWCGSTNDVRGHDGREKVCARHRDIIAGQAHEGSGISNPAETVCRVLDADTVATYWPPISTLWRIPADLDAAYAARGITRPPDEHEFPRSLRSMRAAATNLTRQRT